MTHLPAPPCETRFSKELIDCFFKDWKDPKYNGQRIGQAFVNYFHWHKTTQDKAAMDWLYEADPSAARVFIRQITSDQ